MNITLKEKRKELIQKYKKEWDIPESQKVWWEKIFIDVEKQDKEFIDDILEFCKKTGAIDEINFIKQKAGEFKK